MADHKPDPRGVKLAVKMLKEIRSVGYREFSLREYERRQEGQKSADQRDIVGDCVREAERSSDPAVLAGFTSLLTDYLMAALAGAPVDVEIYDDLDSYLKGNPEIDDVLKEPPRLRLVRGSSGA